MGLPSEISDRLVNIKVSEQSNAVAIGERVGILSQAISRCGKT
jgi:hypothetical protein